jgi:hypothetical protein
MALNRVGIHDLSVWGGDDSWCHCYRPLLI